MSSARTVSNYYGVSPPKASTMALICGSARPRVMTAAGVDLPQHGIVRDLATDAFAKVD